MSEKNIHSISDNCPRDNVEHGDKYRPIERNTAQASVQKLVSRCPDDSNNSSNNTGSSSKKKRNKKKCFKCTKKLCLGMKKECKYCNNFYCLSHGSPDFHECPHIDEYLTGCRNKFSKKLTEYKCVAVKVKDKL